MSELTVSEWLDELLNSLICPFMSLASRVSSRAASTGNKADTNGLVRSAYDEMSEISMWNIFYWN